MKLERLLFSARANARSLAFKVRSTLREIVVSFIFATMLQRRTSSYQEALRHTFPLTLR